MDLPKWVILHLAKTFHHDFGDYQEIVLWYDREYFDSKEESEDEAGQEMYDLFWSHAKASTLPDQTSIVANNPEMAPAVSAKDNSIVNFLLTIFNAIIPNFRKGGGSFKLLSK